MAKGKNKQSKKDRRNRSKKSGAPVSFMDEKVHVSRVRKKEPFKPKTKAQALYAVAIRSNTLTFGLGPAGTGKTHVAVALAAQMLEEKMIETIIITRPAVEAGESLGFLPGELKDKFAPYLAPVAEILYKSLGQGVTEAFLENEKIKIMPLAYMRGHTFENCFIIADEMENATESQVQMLLTRVGEGSKVVVNGDLAQKDISGRSGLAQAPNLLKNLEGITSFTFENSDIMRSGFVAKIISRYNSSVEQEKSQDYNANEFEESNTPQYLKGQ